MNRNAALYRFELKKVLFAPAIIGLAALCVILNGILVLAYYNNYSDYARETDLSGMSDIFDDYDAVGIIAVRYIGRHALTGDYADNVREKYGKLQAVIDKKAANDESLSPYFGGNTAYLHRLLFKTLFGAVAAETGLLALFISLLSVGYENTRNTEGVIYAAGTGRNILYHKLFASLTAAILFLVLILVLTLAVFFARFDWSSVWKDNVSSLFNSSVNEYSKAFITWHSFTVSGYLLACIGITAGITVSFCLLGFATGTLIRNGYASCATAVALCGTMYVALPIAPVGGVLRSALNLTPVRLWANAGSWFTDGYADILWANFECLGVACSLAALTVISRFAVMIFKRRDLL
jgi:hypothetical protein